MLIWGNLWPLLLYPLVWAAIRYGVIRNEEAHLRAKFGDTYLQYCQRVRRWL
jgi:protein-S-isoprenylcysteine O-methyltransferase Ste14